ncbi:hypothetical protein ACWEOW_15065 [Monashia sp. NPDC004114]
MTEKPAGWYYVGDGKLRYRDDYGWTEFYMDTTDPRAEKWPPPTPKTMLQQVREDEAKRSAEAAARSGGWFSRSRKARKPDGRTA